MQHEVFEHDLGGAKGLVVHVPGTRVVNLVVRFNSGFQFADPSAYEVPHVLEHLLLAGSKKKFPKHQAFSVELQKNGAFINAYTSAISNGYVSELANFELERFIQLQHDYFLEHIFEPKGLETEIGNVRQELTRNTTQPGAACSIAYAALAYPDHYKLFEDRIDQLPGITTESYKNYYESSHTWRNMRIFLSGDFQDGGKIAMEGLKAALKGLPSGQRFNPERQPGRAFEPVAIGRDIDQIYYTLGWFTGPLKVEKWPALVILRSLIGEGLGSRIYGKVREQGLAYHIDCGVDFDPGSCSLEFSGYVTADNAEALYKLVAAEMEAIKRGEVTANEVDRVIKLRTGSQLRGYQTAGQMLNWYMSHYEEREVVEDFDGWINKLRAVTREQVIEAARYLCQTDARGSVYFGKVNDADAGRFAKLLDPI